MPPIISHNNSEATHYTTTTAPTNSTDSESDASTDESLSDRSGATTHHTLSASSDISESEHSHTSEHMECSKT